MAGDTATIDATKTVSRFVCLTVRLTGVRRWRLRMWLGLSLIRLGSFVSGIGTVVDVSESNNSQK